VQAAQVEAPGRGRDAVRGTTIPRYASLIEHTCAKLDWDPADFYVKRVRLDYPLPGMQICMVLPLLES